MCPFRSLILLGVGGQEPEINDITEDMYATDVFMTRGQAHGVQNRFDGGFIRQLAGIFAVEEAQMPAGTTALQFVAEDDEHFRRLGHEYRLFFHSLKALIRAGVHFDHAQGMSPGKGKGFLELTGAFIWAARNPLFWARFFHS